MTIKRCERCRGSINLKKDKYVLLGTYFRGKALEELFFHIQCWRLHFEDKVREKARAVVEGMQKRIMPIAKELIGRVMPH